MKINRQKFTDALTKVSKATKSAETLFPTDKIGIEIKNGRITLYSSTPTLKVQSSFDVDTTEELKATVSSKFLLGVVKKLPSHMDELEVSYKEGKFCIGKSSFKVDLLDSMEYMSRIGNLEEIPKYNPGGLKSALRSVVHAADNEASDTVLASVNISNQKIVATDSFRISIRKDIGSLEKNIVVFAKDLATALNILDDDNYDFRVSSKYVYLASCDTTCAVSLCSRVYYELTRVTEADYTNERVAKRKEILECLQLCAALDKEVYIELGKAGIVFSTANTLSEARLKVPCKVKRGYREIKTKLNLSYLLDALSALTCDEVLIKYERENRSIVFSSLDLKEEEYILPKVG